MKIRIIALVCIAAAFGLNSCSKDGDNSSTLQIRMTDAPALWDEVNIDLQGVEVRFEKDSTKWLTLTANPGIYNLLGLQNGVDTLIAQGNFPTGIVKEIRLIVGTNNTVKVSGVVFPLSIPSGSETGLKIKVNKKLQATLMTLVIDFDAELSIKLEGGGYKLKPVIKLK